MANSASAVVTVSNKLGLHARPATLFAELASTFSSDITVRRCDQDEVVNGKSILNLMTLAATQGTKIEITANEVDAQEAIDALVKLVDSGFQEE